MSCDEPDEEEEEEEEDLVEVDKTVKQTDSSPLTLVNFLPLSNDDHEKKANVRTPPTLKKPTEPTSIILEKIKKINQLQERINDINAKIKHIDMSSSSSTVAPTTLDVSKNYYSLHEDVSFKELMFDEPEHEVTSAQAGSQQSKGGHYYINPKYCDEEEEEDLELLYRSPHTHTKRTRQRQRPEESSEDDEDAKDNIQRHRQLNNRTRLGLRKESPEEEEEKDSSSDSELTETAKSSAEYFEDCCLSSSESGTLCSSRNVRFLGSQTDEDVNECGILYEDDDEEGEEEEDEEDDLLFSGSSFLSGNYKQAQPVHKKYASTGFLFHRFGGYLAPIDEDVEEQMGNTENVETPGTSRATQSDEQNLATRIKSATSCFNLSGSSVSYNISSSQNENMSKDYILSFIIGIATLSVL